MDFNELGLNSALLNAIELAGFTKPTAVQEKAIPHILENRGDLIALAQTGTGKTAAFGLPLLQNIEAGGKNPRALILCPTRELCLQTRKELSSFSSKIKGPRITAVYGGEPIYTQIKELSRGTDILSATPGRLIDLVNRKKVDLGNIQYVVLDEADEMLNMGFREELQEILKSVPDDRTNLLFSATMPSAVETIVHTYMKEPEKIVIGRKNAGADNVRHLYYRVHARDRYFALKRLADSHPDIYGIIFCRTRQETRDIAEKLIGDNYSADALHGDLSQAQRDYVMQKFRQKNIRMLVATDVAARGIDVQDLTHVINYNLPDDPESYTHRSGRTGRAGKKGESLSIINMREQYRIKQIERFTGKKFEHAMVPDGKSICEIRLKDMIDRVKSIEINSAQLTPFMDDIHEKLETMDRHELIERFLSLEFNRFLEYYKNAPDLNISSSKQSNRTDRSYKGRPDRTRGKKPKRGNQPEQGYDRVFINAGKKDGIGPGDIINLLKRFTRDRHIDVGRIDLGPAFSFFEVPESSLPSVLKGLNGKPFKGRELSVKKARPEKK